MTEAEARKAARIALNLDDDEDDDSIGVAHGRGHSGTGWYAWHAEYPSEGSVRVDVPRKHKRKEGT